MQDGLYPWSCSNFVQNLKQQIITLPPAEEPTGAVSPSISFASIHYAAGNSMPEIERVLSEETVVPMVKRPKWSFRFPFVDDANPSEAETALNHVYAGTMARTLSQVWIVWNFE